MPRAPGSVCLKVLAVAAVGVVNPAVQHQFPGTALDLCCGNLSKQRYGIVVKLPPAYGVEVAEQAAGVMVPTPPHVAGQCPEPLLGGSNQAVESSGLIHQG